jgi:hypothetical protein
MARYTPGNVPTDPQQLSSFLRDELNKMAQALDTADPFITLDTLYAYPPKYREGTIFKADGTTLNPGSGAGIYCRTGGAWVLLG